MKLPVSRITLRLYIVGLIQAALGVAAAMAVVFSAFRVHPELDEHVILNFPVEQLTYELATPATFEERARTIARQLHMTFRVDAHGRSWTFAAPEPLESCWSSPPPTEVAEEANSNRTCLARKVTLSDGSSASIMVARGRLGLTLRQIAAMHAVIFAVGSLLLGSSLVRPLRHMSAVARAFGRGDANARVRLKRGDELGDVARAFDEMADQVVDGRRAERELLANVSHELRTPLARIRLALEFASDAKPDVAFQSRKDIAEDLDELEVLLADILGAARLDAEGAPSGISPLRKEEVVVHDLVGRAEARFRSAHPGRALRVLKNAPGHTLEIDPIQIRRAIDNVLENAHKYTPDPDREIELRVDATDATVTIAVVDHGVGISADDQRLLFRPFFRADRSRSRTTGGLGLGLVLVRRIAEAHGGTVTLESELGRGTAVRIALPI